MEIELNRFTPAEQATFRLRALYEQAGYRKYRASRFEEYALYQEYQRFLPDAQVITFTDLDGKLRAIKPDVTLSIAKTAQPAAGECKRFYYNEEVCRPSRESHTFQTIHQMGLESMGAVDADEQAAVVRLALQSLAAPLPPVQQQGREKSWLNIALPKGRLGDKAYKLLAGAGYSATEDYNDTRKLVVENPDACVRYFLVKPSDVAIYVEHGAADIGIVGKDILTESGADVYELLDTGMGKCRMCVAGPAGFTDDESRALRVATKFVNIARDHYERRGRDIDIVKLNGSIELAPILGLSDVIVDIVETGTTLKENDLTVIEEFMPISARFIANKASYKFKYAQLTELLNKMKEALAK